MVFYGFHGFHDFIVFASFDGFDGFMVLMVSDGFDVRMDVFDGFGGVDSIRNCIWLVSGFGD